MLTSIRRWRSYVWGRQRKNLLFAGVGLLLSGGLLAYGYCFWEDFSGWTPLDAFFGLFTATFALLIWGAELEEQRLRSLPKRLTVAFLHRDPQGQGVPRVAFLCERAYLASEEECRSWGQQIGRQMKDGNLTFAPGIVTFPATEEARSGSAGTFLHYRMVFQLEEEKPTDKKGKIPDFPSCLHWRLEEGKFSAQAKLWTEVHFHPDKADTPAELFSLVGPELSPPKPVASETSGAGGGDTRQPG
jgi:hypothetical protein